MGHVYVEATISGSRRARARFLVDTGASYCLVSPDLAKKAHLVPYHRRERVRLADGSVVNLPIFGGMIKVDGREASTVFWVGPCDEPLLGVETLEVLGLAVDPSRGQLKPTRPYATRLGGFGPR